VTRLPPGLPRLDQRDLPSREKSDPPSLLGAPRERGLKRRKTVTEEIRLRQTTDGATSAVPFGQQGHTVGVLVVNQKLGLARPTQAKFETCLAQMESGRWH
jgi:hypothetical protein